MSRRGKRGGGRKVNRRRRISGIGGLAPARVSEALRSASRCLRRVILPAVAGAAALTLVWVASHYVLTGPYFRLGKVEIQGLHRLSEAEILRAAGLTLRGTSTLGLDVEAVAADLRALPWVAEAEVERWLPDRLVVRVTERVAEALVVDTVEAPGEAQAGSAYILADAYGRRFALPERPSDLDLPAITGVGGGAVDALVGDRRLKTGLAALREWRRQGLDALDDLSEIHVDPAAGLTLYTQREGSAIRVGRTDLAARLARVRAVLADLQARGERAEYVLADDDRDGDRVVVRAAPRATVVRRATAEMPADVENVIGTETRIPGRGHGKQG